MVPWPTMKTMLNICELSIGMGRDKTIERLLDENKKGNKFDDNFEKLKNLYYDYLLVGNKAIKIFNSERKIIDELITSFQSHQIEETVFQETYPFSLPEEKLKETDLFPKLVDIKDTNENLSLVFCTRHSFTERIEINPEELSIEAKDYFNDYDEIIGIKRYIRQFFNVVVLWKKKILIEVRIDIANGVSSQERNTAFFETVGQFNNLAREKLGIETTLNECINFFPLIDNLYKSSGEGKVGEIAFNTDEGSTKSERMRRGAVDLRDEIYHKAGREAVDHITPYRLAILWNFKISEYIETQIELFLPGKSRALSSTEQRLEEVIIKKCSVLEEYNFILDKINMYLNNVS
ncbi:hypothetical protein [Nostoc sp. 'Peltigera membranacea cyanobiont' 210A]|uniref:hypothetical protein n=1 Tax=Nostoc sp. 'Peltigera membranacea cyanobiont' 210A TaxID=2014529 RepID=UPI0011801928|nr:hypothetical protein [Nostoc sp. 'Peltigera membranacea cyanobiont' 210A]